MHYHNKRASRTILTILAAAGISFSSFGCQGPEEITEFNRLTATDGDTYEVDLIMLSELSGRILPQKDKSFIIAKDKNNNFCLSTKLIGDDEKCEDNSQINDIVQPKDESQMYITPYKYISDAFDSDKITCLSIEENKYECRPYFSGMVMIEKIWNEIFHQGDASIRIGNGDSYGVSNGLSKDNDNVPTILTLNQLGFDVDTFGNHTFDNSDSLEWLRKHIETARFSFTVSNLTNIIQNLKDVKTFTIFDIPSSNGQGNPLHVAVVGVVDESLGDTISKGYMGTLTSASYCNAIYAMEDAYNLNARAFVILAHVFSYQPKNLTSFIRTLHDALLNGISKSSCPNSRLIITNEMLEEARKTQKGIDAESLRNEMRKDIFNNILAIFNEEGDVPIFSVIDDYDEFLKHDEIENDSNTNLFLAHSRFVLNYHENAEFQRQFFNNYYQFKYTRNTTSREDDKELEYPLLYVQFPAKGSHTAKVSFTLKAREQNIATDKTNTIANNYQTQLESIELQPVLSSGNREVVNDTITETYNYSYCNELMGKFASSYQLTECKEYFSDYIKYLKTNRNSDDKPSAHNCLSQVRCAIHYDQNSCQTKSSPKAMETKDLEALFSCMYNATLWDYNQSSKQFEKTSICNFKNYTIAGENRNYETRAFTTFIGNFITDIVLNELRKVESKKYDLVIMNSGTARDTSDFFEIDSEFFQDTFPFENKLFSIQFSTDELLKYIDYGLNPNTDGAFPIFSGIQVYYHEYDRKKGTEIRTDNLQKKRIVEIWTTNENNELVNPVYLEKCPTSEHPEQCMNDGSCCVKEGKSKLCKDEKCMAIFNKYFSTSHQDDTYNVVITSYMQGGGDQYPAQDNYEDVSSLNGNQTIIGIIKDALMDATKPEDHSCRLALTKDKKLETEDFLKRLLKKHLFTNLDINKNESYSTDYSDNRCIATQKALIDVLSQLDETFKTYCD